MSPQLMISFQKDGSMQSKGLTNIYILN